MPLFKPFTESWPLPMERQTYEKDTLDLKQRGELTTPIYRAKDIAAFANHIGGTLIILVVMVGPSIVATVLLVASALFQRYRTSTSTSCSRRRITPQSTPGSLGRPAN